jgi:phenylalanyl-tRNA synthetase beta subunit
LFELNLEVLGTLSKAPVFKAVINTPTVIRDITADLAVGIEFASVRACILAEGGRNLKEVELVSVFKLDEKSHSLSFRLRLQHPEKTLTADEIDSLINRIKAGLGKRLGATYRG